LPGVLSSGRATRREADHSPPSRVEVKKELNSTSIHSLHLLSVNNDNFTFILPAILILLGDMRCYLVNISLNQRCVDKVGLNGKTNRHRKNCWNNKLTNVLSVQCVLLQGLRITASELELFPLEWTIELLSSP
jgi:hypothetical protein